MGMVLGAGFATAVASLGIWCSNHLSCPQYCIGALARGPGTSTLGVSRLSVSQGQQGGPKPIALSLFSTPDSCVFNENFATTRRTALAETPGTQVAPGRREPKPGATWRLASQHELVNSFYHRLETCVSHTMVIGSGTQRTNWEQVLQTQAVSLRKNTQPPRTPLIPQSQRTHGL